MPGRGGGMPPGGPYGMGPQDPEGGQRRTLLIVIIAAAVVVLLAVGAAVFYVRSRAEKAAAPISSAPPSPILRTPTPPPTPSPTPSASESGSASPSASASSEPPVEIDLPASAPLPENQIVVPIRRGGQQSDLYLVDLDKQAAPKKLKTPDGADFNALMQPVRDTIIYLNDTQLRVMAADGSDDQALLESTPKACGAVRHASWDQADSGQLLLQCEPTDGLNKLLVMRLDGKIVRQLNVGKSRIEDPTVSPDGSTAAFWASDSATIDGGSIYTVPIDGSAPPTRLTKVAVGVDADPSWSPDGSRIAFRRRVANGTEDGNYDVYVMNSDGTGVRSVAKTAARDIKPVWSPDNEELLIVSNRTSANGGAGQTYDLWRTRVSDGKVIGQLGLNATYITTPFWTVR